MRPGASAGHNHPWILMLILVLAFALRAWHLDQKNIWLDEAASWHMATSSVTGLIETTSGDIHPPLYYLLLKGWISMFGDSLAGLRSLSVVASLVAVVLIRRLASRGLPNGVALAAVFWFAISPHAIFYSQEARMYALVTATVLGACLAYRHWIESGFAARGALAAYAACAVVSLYLHYFSALLLAAIWAHAVLIAAGQRSSAAADSVPRFRWLPWIGAHAAVALLYVPWIATAIAQMTRGQGWRQPVSLSQIPEYAGVFLATLMVGVYRLPTAGIVLSSLAGCVVVLGVFSLGKVLATRRGTEHDVFLACVGLLPILFGLGLLPVTGQMELSRYVPFALPLLVLLVARGLTVSGLRPVAAAAVMLIGALATLPGLITYFVTPIKDSDARPIAAYLSGAARRGPDAGQDAIFVAPGYMDIVLQYAERDLELRRIGSGTDPMQAIAAETSGGAPAWLVVDYRWPGYQQLSEDGRLTRVPLTPDAKGMKLFRVGPRSGLTSRPGQ